MKFKYSYILICACLWTIPVSADNDWEVRRDRDGIQVYTRKVEGSRYSAVRTTTVVERVRLASLVALIRDAEACASWADKCAESFVHERVSETEAYVYTHNSMPFPVKDRDVLAHVRWSQNPSTLVVTMESTATVGIMEEKRRRLRLTEAKASWNFVPLSSGAVEVTNEAHINPGSSLPGWVTNMLLVDTPFQTMKSFVKEVSKSKYQNASLSFIEEPAPR